MKRKPIILAFALLLVVGAALWGVNYRLNHPPLTQADKEFRALVAGADGVEILYEKCCLGESRSDGTIQFQNLNAHQTRDFIESLRFLDDSPRINIIGFGMHIRFFRQSSELALIQLNQNLKSSNFSHLVEDKQQSAPSVRQIFYLNPRFNKRLNRALDAYLPQRIRP